jgi:quinol monooxygenase YgiN
MEKDEMLTIFFYMWIKPGREAECAKVVREAMVSTRADDEGCIDYTFYRQSDEARRLVLFEHWRDGDALNAHIARLQRVFGPQTRTSRIHERITSGACQRRSLTCSRRQGGSVRGLCVTRPTRGFSCANRTPGNRRPND